MSGNLQKAVEICRMVESHAPNYGAHVGLTGGCLYKDGDRKDVDILFYRIRQVEKIDHEGLKACLEANGFTDISGFGWLWKAKFMGMNIDMFFPEEIEGAEYTESESNSLPATEVQQLATRRTTAMKAANVVDLNQEELNAADAGTLRAAYNRVAADNQVLRDRIDALMDRGQVAGVVNHYLEGEPVRVDLTSSGLSIPAGAPLFSAPGDWRILNLVFSDSLAASCQSVAQYRKALLDNFEGDGDE